MRGVCFDEAGKPFEEFEPPTMKFIPVARKLDNTPFAPSREPHILWDGPSAMFVPRVPGRRLPACRTIAEARDELRRHWRV